MLSPEKQLMVAARSGNEELTRHLLEQGVSANYVDDRGYSPLMQAALYGRAETVSLLVREGEADVNHVAYSGATPLLCALAARRGREQMVRMLLERGADVNHADDLGFTALITAALDGSTAVGAMLLSRGADVGRVSIEGKTALEIARERGNLSFADMVEAHARRVRQARIGARRRLSERVPRKDAASGGGSAGGQGGRAAAGGPPPVGVLERQAPLRRRGWAAALGDAFEDYGTVVGAGAALLLAAALLRRRAGQ